MNKTMPAFKELQTSSSRPDQIERRKTEST
jgi:hypothetical protein